MVKKYSVWGVTISFGIVSSNIDFEYQQRTLPSFLKNDDVVIRKRAIKRSCI